MKFQSRNKGDITSGGESGGGGGGKFWRVKEEEESSFLKTETTDDIKSESDTIKVIETKFSPLFVQLGSLFGRNLNPFLEERGTLKEGFRDLEELIHFLQWEKRNARNGMDKKVQEMCGM